MHDETLERELETLLSVDPAPDFRARVLERVANEPLRSAWSMPWTFAAAGLSVAGALLVMVLRAPSPPQGDLASPSLQLSAHQAVPLAIQSRRVTRRGPAVSVAPPAKRAHALQAVVAIIDPSEAAAWRDLLASVNSGNVELPRLSPAKESPVSSTAFGDFALPPIVIESLTPEREGVHP